ncbi:alginate O-acetyltransferase AlgF [Spirochaeta africana]|uniref:Alginate biosynthesis protein AlgF n=1 Tax=Spirochaeta africana (strain ATCC 700263 / DSM 8902 / Z-7692) TaxID=889378 RepID=H9UGT5_SPIAZ|nr:alginate O-acetyltransferase AlgF [Spirochaeta africana]AFG36728.1 Alginate O-acetyl transferase AlgF [Spirochaeta africana DSM 8902]
MHRYRFRTFFVLLALLILLPSGVSAQSASLYGEAAPDDAAFVRIYNALVEPQTTWVGSVEFASAEPGQATAYRPVNPGVHAVFSGNEYAELIARDAEFFTVILEPRGPQVHQDRRHTRADQAQLVVYNIDLDGPVSLKTGDGSVTVVDAVESGGAGSVSVNPAAVELVLQPPQGSSLELGDIGMQRGQSYAMFVFLQDGRPQVQLQQAEILAQ